MSQPVSKYKFQAPPPIPLSHLKDDLNQVGAVTGSSSHRERVFTPYPVSSPSLTLPTPLPNPIPRHLAVAATASSSSSAAAGSGGIGGNGGATSSPSSLASPSLNSAHRSQFNAANMLKSPASTFAPTAFTTSSSMRPQPPAVHARPYFRSRRIVPGSADKPWIDPARTKKTKSERWVNIIPLMGFLIGFIGAAALIYGGVKEVVINDYCLVLDENWSSGINPQTWTKEGQVSGFVTGGFQQYTPFPENVFLNGQALHIRPTLQDPAYFQNGSVLSYPPLSDNCTQATIAACSAVTNTNNGSLVPPIRSALLTTRLAPSRQHIQYGRVEVTARFPRGKWLWPRITLRPANATYGSYPTSGQIDIAVGRGNDVTYPYGGINYVDSGLHFGPVLDVDGYHVTVRQRKALLSSYADTGREHTFGLEWSPGYIFAYVDDRIFETMYFAFNNHTKSAAGTYENPLWAEGNFPLSTSNGTRLTDPWTFTGRPSTPFDQPFYLTLGTAVGGTSGWFADNVDGKPWVDASVSAKQDFWTAEKEWLPTWGQEGDESSDLVISRVQMWQQKGFNGC